MLQQITSLTGAPKHLSLPPGVTGPNVTAVQAKHGRRMERTANALRREAAQATTVAWCTSSPQPTSTRVCIMPPSKAIAAPLVCYRHCHTSFLLARRYDKT